MVDIASHARHDRLAIAAALGGGALPSTVRTCPSCGALHGDLLSIQSAIRHAWTPRLPRDLRLRSGDVAGGKRILWRRVADTFGSSRDAVTRPLALGLTSLGIAGLALANVSMGAPGDYRAGGASAAASPEISDPVSVLIVTTPGDSRTNHDAPGPEPIMVVSAASLAVGGTLLGARRIASRRRAVR